MDRIIANFAMEDGDLILCPAHGVAYQRDMTQRVVYDETYWDKCASYEGKEIAQAINRGRVEIVAKHFSPVSRVLDIGVGSGEFIKNRPNTYGHDVNPTAIEWLKSQRRWIEPDRISSFWAFTFWDVIEHVETPEDYFRHVPGGAYLFTSIPIFEDLTKIRESRHYRPGEHLYYFTEKGFVSWMALHDFRFIERQTFEMDAGRDSIYTFAFQRNDRPCASTPR